MNNRIFPLSCVLLILSFVSPVFGGNVTVWIGTDVGPDDERRGIYRATLNTDNGHLSRPERAAKIGSTRFLTLHPDNRTLYTVRSRSFATTRKAATWIRFRR